MTPRTADKNGEGDSETVTVVAEWLPVSECAQRLDVTLPRLLRMLKRPEFAAQTEKQERQSRTGTRTVTVVSVSVLPALKTVFDEGNGEQKRKHSQGEPLPFLADETTRAYLAAMMQQADARIAEQAATIADLRRDKDDLRGRLALAEGEQKRLQGEVLALASKPAQESPQDALHAPNMGDTAAGGQSAQPEKARSFWAFWKTGKHQ